MTIPTLKEEFMSDIGQDRVLDMRGEFLTAYPMTEVPT